MRLKIIPASAPLFPASAAYAEDDELAFLALSETADQEPGRAPTPWPRDPALRMAAMLRLHDVPDRLCEAIAEAAGPAGDFEAGLAAIFAFLPWQRAVRDRRVVLVGPPGAGKTVLAGKIAARLRRHALLVNADVERPASTVQLEEVAKVLGLTVKIAPNASAARALLASHPAVPAIIDTAGVDGADREAVSRLGELVEATGAVPLLVLPADIGPEEAVAAAQGFAAIGASHLMITRLDMVRRLGGPLAAAHATGMALAGGGFAPHFAFGLRPLSAGILARRITLAALDERRWSAVPRVERVA